MPGLWGHLQGGLSGADRREKTLLPPRSTFELDRPLASTNSVGLARGLGTFLSEGRTVTSGTVPGCGIILGTEMLQIEEIQGVWSLKSSLTQEPHGLLHSET